MLLSGDCKDLLDCLSSWGSPSDPSIHSIIDDILVDLSAFDSRDVLFIPRDENYLAHNIARWAAFCNIDGPIAISSIPSSVLTGDEEM
ncbi:hypothetical protein CDL15_Pgr021023 [Punica granatum]|uniref:Uncharacterized protein n=1 Tax=Punica granatum TaxID=22663 RepID=A0A218Y0W6_PUNGR|nr:hypothetical protein CDL15_Pgr021023 [Punica granatum]PKH69526.1 hypothetical protein CRG98_050107 [Punica granatum]